MFGTWRCPRSLSQSAFNDIEEEITATFTDYDYTDGDYSKLRIIMPLVDPRKWGGGVLGIGNSLAMPSLRCGDAVVFPSFTLHGVSRVFRGSRIILSAWVSGPALR